MKAKFLMTVLVATSALSALPAHADMMAGEVQLKPYVYGTVGVAQDGYKTRSRSFNDRDSAVAGQLGVGVQLNEYMGGEVYYEGGDQFRYTNKAGQRQKIRAHTVGTRATIGTGTDSRARVFAKVGVAAVRHQIGEREATRPQFTAGVGATYAINDHFSVRGDYDHKFKRSSDVDRKGSDYVGVGGQVDF